MITKEDLKTSFSRLRALEENIYRCEDVLPKRSFFTYVKLGEVGERLTVSESLIDDRFAIDLLKACEGVDCGAGLALKDAPENQYGFSTMLLAPSEFHNQLRGRLDSKREATTLCIPIHRCGFSGIEAKAEFQLMCNRLVSVWDWKRGVCPKVVLRFDNPKTGAGTGDRDVLVRWKALQQELEALNGVADGFVEVQNYLGQVLELLSVHRDMYWVIRDRNDAQKELVQGKDLERLVWRFFADDER